MEKAFAKTWTRITTELVGHQHAGKQQGSMGLRREPKVLHWSLFHQRKPETGIHNRWAKAQTQRQNLSCKHLDFVLGFGYVGFLETNVEPREVVFHSVGQALTPDSPIPSYSFSFPLPLQYTLH